MALRDWTKYVWEAEETAPPTAKLDTRQSVISTTPAPPQPISTAPNPAYDTLLAHTSFESTDAGKVYLKYYNKLTRITDEHERRATAIDLASNDNVDQKALSNTFVILNEQLRTEEEHFDQTFTQRQQQDVAGPTQQVDDLAKQIDTLQKQKAQLEARIQPALDRLNTVKLQFQAAVDRRKNELEAQRKMFLGE